MRDSPSEAASRPAACGAASKRPVSAPRTMAARRLSGSVASPNSSTITSNVQASPRWLQCTPSTSNGVAREALRHAVDLRRRDEQEHRARIDEAADEPGAGDAVDLGPRARHPDGAALRVERRHLGGRHQRQAGLAPALEAVLQPSAGTPAWRSQAATPWLSLAPFWQIDDGGAAGEFRAPNPRHRRAGAASSRESGWGSALKSSSVRTSSRTGQCGVPIRRASLSMEMVLIDDMVRPLCVSGTRFFSMSPRGEIAFPMGAIRATFATVCQAGRALRRSGAGCSCVGAGASLHVQSCGSCRQPRKSHARGNPEHRRRHQAVGRAAEEASLTSTRRASAPCRAEQAGRRPQPLERPAARAARDAGAHRARRPAHLDRPHRARARRPAHHDRARRGREGSAGRRRGRGRAASKLKAEVARRELEALLSGEADGNDSYLEVHAGAGGTESQDWANMLHAHVHALGRAARLQGRVDRGDRRRGGRHQVGDRPDQGPQRLWLAQDRERRAPAGAHLAVRFQRAPPHLVRQRQRLSGDRRPHQDRHQGSRRAHRYDARAAAPAASTSTRPSRRSASRTSRPTSWCFARTTARSTATARRPGTCCARGSTSWS